MQKLLMLSTKTTFPRNYRLPGSLLFLLVLLMFGLAACAPSTGLFAGGNWQAGGLQNQHIQVFAVDPNHLQDIYAGDTQNGVFASTDAGVTWKQSTAGLPLPVNIHALAFDTAGKKFYAATSAGLFVSGDSAGNWNAVANVPADAYTALTFDINSPHTVYAGTAHSGVLKSTDDGGSWTRISNGLPAGDAITSMLYDPNLKQLWAAFAGTLYRSDDGGASWHAMSNGLPANVGINALALGAVSASNTSLLFAGTDQGFFRSTDAGQHWAQSQFSLAAVGVHAVLVDATQPNLVYVSTNIGVLRSQDNGQNWDQLASGLPSGQSFGDLVQGGANNAQLFVASRGIYFYPGSGSAFDPSRLFPILLILLFFFFLYRFFVMRRRPAKKSATGAGTPTVRDVPATDHAQNGNIPSPGVAPDTQSNEQKES